MEGTFNPVSIHVYSSDKSLPICPVMTSFLNYTYGLENKSKTNGQLPSWNMFMS